MLEGDREGGVSDTCLKWHLYGAIVSLSHLCLQPSCRTPFSRGGGAGLGLRNSIPSTFSITVIAASRVASRHRGWKSTPVATSCESFGRKL